MSKPYPRGVNLRVKLNDNIMCVVKFFKNVPKKPSSHKKAINRMPIEPGGTLETTGTVQSNYVLSKIQIPLFC